MLHYSWKWKDHEGSGYISEEEFFKEGQAGMTESFNAINGKDGKGLIFQTFSRDEKGIVTMTLYHTKGCK